MVCFCQTTRSSTPGFSPRANQTFVVEDGILSARNGIFTPRYDDTTQANTFLFKDTCGNVVYLYSTNTLWYRSCASGVKAWVEIGAGGGGGVSTATSAPYYQSGVVVVDKGRYDAFPSAFTKQDTIFVASKNAASHAAAGAGTIYRSIDGGLHYDSLTVGTDSLVSNYFAGQVNDTTTVYAFNGADLQRLYIRRSIDGLQSFQTVDSIILTGNDKGVFFAGHGVTLPSGKYLFPAYFSNTVTGTYSSEIIATDDGINYDRYGIIFSGATPKNEASFEWINGDTLLAILRNNSGTYPEQYMSTDGGVTFALQGNATPFGVESALGPSYLKKWNGRMYLVKGVRTTIGSGGSYIGVSECTVAQALAGVSSWSAPSRIYESRWQYKTAAIDFGYPSVLEYNGQLSTVFYDLSPLSVFGAPQSDRKARIVTMSLLGHSNYERNNKTAQSITANTSVGVDYSSAVYEGDNSWSSADTAFKFERDGVYMIHASFTFPADTTGSFRQGLLKVIDPGRNDTVANQLLDKITITGSDNTEFNRIDLRGMAYIQAGMLVKVFARHDATTSQSLVNTQIEQRAKIYIKKID